MNNYVIEEIFDIDCTDDGFLSVNIRLEEEGNIRTIENSEYYYWAKELSETDTDSVDVDFEGYSSEDTPNELFDFTEWVEYYHGEDMVIDFIYEMYPTIEDLPD